MLIAPKTMGNGFLVQKLSLVELPSEAALSSQRNHADKSIRLLLTAQGPSLLTKKHLARIWSQDVF